VETIECVFFVWAHAAGLHTRAVVSLLFFKVSVSSLHLEVSENGHVSAISYFSYGTISASKYTESILFQGCLIMYNHWF